MPPRLVIPSAIIALAACTASAPAKIPVQGVEIVREYPHDPGAFTQGLFFLDGHLYESTGQIGQSTIRKVRLSDGAVLQRADIPPPHFGEGIVHWKGSIVGVTWQSGTGFRWDRKTFKKTGEFGYSGEGWGLAQDGRSIILSDGTPTLRFLDPATMTEARRVTVTLNGKPLRNLNEIEYVNGEILANVWMTDSIVRIDPANGAVRGIIDLSKLAAGVGRRSQDDVLNGIAYDSVGKRLFVTGKNWPRLYEIKLTAAR